MPLVNRPTNMKVLASLGFFAMLVSSAFCQARPIADGGFFRIQVLHADPWLVKALLEGTSVMQPELSTILNFAGVPDKDSELITSLFGGPGRIVINPTDNSLLFFPKKA
jgi:hypothetical protein